MKQNCILKVFKDGTCITFERFTCKRAKTVLNQYKKLFLPLDHNFFKDYWKGDTIQIIATPDGYNEGNVMAEYTPEQFFEAIAQGTSCEKKIKKICNVIFI